MSELTERTKRQIALLAGDDLEGELQQDARRSVDNCDLCRDHWIRLRGCLDVLERAGKSTEFPQTASLWPAIESQMQSAVVVRPVERFNGWVPALSMAAACIALLIAGQHDGVSPESFAAGPYGGAFEAGAFPRTSNVPRLFPKSSRNDTLNVGRHFALPNFERPGDPLVQPFSPGTPLDLSGADHIAPADSHAAGWLR